MTYSPERFYELFKEFEEEEQKIRAWKAGEYSTTDDRLQNFREVSAFTGLSMSQVALLYMLKHTQSIKNAVMAGRYVWKWEGAGGEGLKQRIADSRNYHLLLAACLDEEADDENMPDAQTKRDRGCRCADGQLAAGGCPGELR